MGDLTAQFNSDLNRIAELKAKGTLLDAIDEQRLRDHQLRRLRRLWLKDQNLRPREPLLKPVKHNWWSGLKAKEEAFWSRALKFREFSGYLYHGKDFHQLPILFLYQSQRFVRNVTTMLILPSLPLVYFLKYGNFDIPGSSLETNLPIYPGDEYMTVRRKDVVWDKKTGNYRPAEKPDDWKRVLIC